MQSEPVDFVVTEMKKVGGYSPTMFSLNPNRRFYWLQKVLFWILKKLRCNAPVEITTTSRVTFQPKDFAEALFEQRAHLLNYYHKKGAYILIGEDTFREWMKFRLSPQSGLLGLSFDASYYADGRVLGMRVCVIPYMRGVLVLPKDFDRTKSL